MSEGPIRVGPGSPDASEFDDPDLRPPQPHEETTSLDSVLQDLEQALREEVTTEPVTLRTKRPSLSVRYDPGQVDEEKMDAWRKRSKDKRAFDDFNSLRFTTTLLANTCQAILVNGLEAHDEDGGLMTFGHFGIKKMICLGDETKARNLSTIECVRRVIGTDPMVLVHANAVMEAAGYADEALEQEDGEGPTRL